MSVSKSRMLMAAGTLALAGMNAGAQPGVEVNPPLDLPPPEKLAVVFSNQPEIMARMPFSRTIGQILSTANTPNTQANRVALLDSWRQTLTETSHNNLGVNVPLTPRAEAQLNSKDLLDPASNTPMVPAAVTYRFDQVSLKQGIRRIKALDCGEVRATYTMGNGFLPAGRMTWILEAKIPNPSETKDSAACLPLVNFVLDLGKQTTAQQADSVEKLLYTGIGSGFGPVIDYNNYQGAYLKNGTERNVSSGQIRANMFVQRPFNQPWMLREWQLVKQDGKPVFRTQSVASTPLPNYWTAPVGGEPADIASRRVEFQNYMLLQGANDLVSQEQQLANDGKTQIKDTQFLSGLAFPLPRKFAAGESLVDFNSNPAFFADPNFEAQFGAAIPKSPPLPYPVAVNQAFNRAHNAGICAGCHQAGQGEQLAQSTIAGEFMVQPPSLGFVHIREPNAASPAAASQYMRQVFPVREQLMRDYVANGGSFEQGLTSADMKAVQELANASKGRTFKPLSLGAAH